MSLPVIRTVRTEDVPTLLSIYAPYVTDTFISFEYEVPSQEEFLQRVQSISQKYPYLVAELDGEICGYAYAGAFKSRTAYSWAVETTVYVRSGCHGQGLGRRLYEELERRLAEQHITNLNACIAYPHPQSIGFHEAMGYRMVGRFEKCGYKLGAWRDMVWMEKHIGEHLVPPPPILPPREQMI